MTALVQTVAPSVEPVSLAEAKLHLRYEGTDDNDLITALIKAARRHAESFTRRQLITATWQLIMDGFPSGSLIEVPRPPLQSVTSITYTDADGDTQPVSADDYDVDTKNQPGRIEPSYGNSWPSTRDEMNTVTVTYKAGYGDAATDVPEDIVAAVKLLVANWYEHREPVVVGTIAAELPLSVKNLLWPYRVLGDM